MKSFSRTEQLNYLILSLASASLVILLNGETLPTWLDVLERFLNLLEIILTIAQRV